MKEREKTRLEIYLSLGKVRNILGRLTLNDEISIISLVVLEKRFS